MIEEETTSAPIFKDPDVQAAYEAAHAAAEKAGYAVPEPEPEDEPIRTVDGGIPICVFCENPIPSTRYAYRKVVGFERQRKQGGTNAVRLRMPLDEYACSTCVESISEGRDPAQAALL